MRTANVRTVVIWTLVALVGRRLVRARARPGEDVSAAWMVAAALGSYAIGYRFYPKFIAHKVLKVDASRATPAERSTTASTSTPPTAASCSATTSPRSRAPVRSSARYGPRRWAISPARSGSPPPQRPSSRR